MIFPEQIRAARALLGLSQLELAERAGVGIATIKRIEAAGELTGNAQTLMRIQTALEAAGVEFLSQTTESGVGLRLAKPKH